MENKIIKVESLDHLKELIKSEVNDYFIALNGGLNSSKSIDIHGDDFHVWNSIDDTTQELNDEQMYSESNIGEAIDKGAFYADLW